MSVIITVADLLERLQELEPDESIAVEGTYITLLRGYDQGYSDGHSAGRLLGRKQIQDELLATLGVSKMVDLSLDSHVAQYHFDQA